MTKGEAQGPKLPQLPDHRKCERRTGTRGHEPAQKLTRVGPVGLTADAMRCDAILTIFSSCYLKVRQPYIDISGNRMLK